MEKEKKATKKQVQPTQKGKEINTEEKKETKKKESKIKGKTLDSILDLNANNVWELSEQAIAEAWNKEREEEDFSISEPKLLNIIRLAFEVVHFNPDNKREAAKFEKGGWATVEHCDSAKGCVAFRRKTIERITDLSYENIKHISASMLLELINRNFGGGWDSISLSMRDIIETGFDISTTQLPASRIHASGGTLEKKVAQGFEVLEIPKGTWVEAIFVKKKDPIEKLRMELPEKEYDEDGNRIHYQDEVDNVEETEEETLDNDDTYFSSISPEADVKDLEEEGLSIEDVSEDED